jgi:hypothetical protein
MQTAIDEAHSVETTHPESPQFAEVTAYNQALHQIEDQLGQLAAGFEQLDKLRIEEEELAGAWAEVENEESNLLANPNGSEKAAVEKLLKVRALRDIRAAKLDGMKKRTAGHIDVIIFDIGQPLRRGLSNLAYALLRRKQDQIEKLFFELLGAPAHHGLPVNTSDLTRRSRPILALQGLYSSIGRDLTKMLPPNSASCDPDC